mmetsp:Transcript_6273/g.9471  ORF Transcript_6273/g.9471 Transcript_6273/m.9471 type:complete len:1457 (+) Transcript_6273:112-4482(+)
MGDNGPVGSTVDERGYWRDDNLYLNHADNDIIEWDERLDISRVLNGLSVDQIDSDPWSNTHRWKGADWGILMRITDRNIRGYIGFYNCNNLPDGYVLNVKSTITILPLPTVSPNIIGPCGVLNYIYRKVPGRNSEDRGKELVQTSYIRSNVHNFVTPDDHIVIRVRLQALPISPVASANYNSKLHTGLVGLENLGATCYLNALLQMLYHVNAFRDSVYTIPFAGEIYDKSTTLSLQNIFNQLQTSDMPVSTTDLTRAFGWDSCDALQQQDVQEMLRVLLDKLEECMKGTPVDGAVKNLFAGKIRSYIRCINIAYESTREEEFYDIQLDVKDCKDVYDSFRKYIAREILTGENQYDAGDGQGKQDAEKGVIFTELPPVLTIHLKRFEFDMRRLGFAKIHDRFEFPLRLDLNEFVDASEAANMEKEQGGQRNIFQLHSVLVHEGDVYGGHYYAFIRPTGQDGFWDDIYTHGMKLSTSGKWYKFDDEHVFSVDRREAVEMCYGEESGAGFSSAYMLVYIRESESAQIMSSVKIPHELNLRLEEERTKKLEELIMQKHIDSFVSVKYFLDEDISMFHEFTSEDDFLSHQNVRSLKFIRGGLYLGLLLAIADELGTSADMIEIWRGEYLDGGLFRVQNPVTIGELVNIVDEHRPPCYFVHLFDEYNDPVLVEKIQSIREKESHILTTVAQTFCPPHLQLSFDPFEGCGIGKGTAPFNILAHDIYDELYAEFGELKQDLLNALRESRNQSTTTSVLVFFKMFDEKFTLPHSPLGRTAADSNFLSFATAVPLIYIGHSIFQENDTMSTLHATGKDMVAAAFERFGYSVPVSWKDIDIVNMISPLQVEEINTREVLNLKNWDVESGDIIGCLPGERHSDVSDDDMKNMGQSPFIRLKKYLKFEAYKVLVHTQPQKDIYFGGYFRRNAGLWIQALHHGIPQNDDIYDSFFNGDGIILSRDIPCTKISSEVSRLLQFPDQHRLSIGKITKTSVGKSMFVSARIKGCTLEKFINSLVSKKYSLEIGCVPFPIVDIDTPQRGLEFILVDDRMRSERMTWLSERIFPQAAALYSEQLKARNVSTVMDLSPVYKEITWPSGVLPVPDEFVSLNRIYIRVPADSAMHLDDLLRIVRHHICLTDEIQHHGNLVASNTEMTGEFSQDENEICSGKRPIHDANVRNVKPKISAISTENESGTDMDAFDYREYPWFKMIQLSQISPMTSHPAIIAFTIFNHQVGNILLSSSQLYTLPGSWVDYFSSDCASFPIHSLGVQYVTVEEWKNMTGCAPLCAGVRMRSFPVAVHRFELYMNFAKPVPSNSGPCLSYIREDDTFESVVHRLSVITGELDLATVRLAVVCKQNIPHYISRVHDSTPTLEVYSGVVEGDPCPDTTDLVVNPSFLSDTSATSKSVWEVFLVHYPEYTIHTELDCSEAGAQLPKLGIQVPSVKAEGATDSNNRGGRPVCGITIRR